MNLNNLINQSRFDQYSTYLKSQNLSDATIRRKLSSLSSFQKFLVKKKLLNPDVIAPAVIASPQGVAILPKPNPSSFFNRYVIVATLLIILSALGYGLYSQTILKAKQQLAYSTAAAPITPGRFLSFQGRLTDSSGNPIISSTNILFKLFDTATVGTGTSLYTSALGNSQTVIPDENGIFSVTIGKSHGSTIPSTVFSENANVYLEITSGGETMDPRQQIATVGYALNSETLQGLPPSASGFKNTVLVIDGSGNLNLGETSPTIISNSGTMGIIGQALLIGTSFGGTGDITLNSYSGKIKLMTSGAGTTATGGFIEATNANLANGNLISAYINNTNRNYNFIDFSNYNLGGGSTLASRFSVTANGNLNVGGTITFSGMPLGAGTTVVYINSTGILSKGILPAGTIYTASSGVTQVGNDFRLNLGTTNVWLASQVFNSNIGVTGNLTVGGTGNFNNIFASGKVGIGLSNPTYALDVFGTIHGATDGSAMTSGIYGDGGLFGIGVYSISSLGFDFYGAGPTSFFAGNVGIGTSNPSKKLDVAGDINLTGTIYGNGSSGVSGQVLSSTGAGLAWVNASSIGSTYVFSNGLTNYGSFVGLGGTLSQLTKIDQNGNNFGLFGGFVGIGTTSPTSPLQISHSGVNQTALVIGDQNTPANNTGIYIRTTGVGVITTGSGGDLQINPGGTGAIGSGNGVRFTATGNVGIGTTNPSQNLELSTNFTTFRMTDANSGYTTAYANTEYYTGIGATIMGNVGFMGDGHLTLENLNASKGIRLKSLAGDVMFISSTGSVGIGTTNPTGKLDISSGSQSLILGADNNSTTRTDNTNKVARISVAHRLNASAPMTAMFSTGSVFSFGGGTSAGNAATQVRFYTAANDTTLNGTEQMRIDSNGNVGIGTTDPKYKLDVAGDIKLTGSLFVGAVGVTGSNGQILTSDGAGSLQWTNASGIGGTYTADNGLHMTGSIVGLGGTLNSLTKIDMNSNNLGFFGTGNIGIGTTNPGAKLQVVSTGNSTYPFSVQNSSGGYLFNARQNSDGTPQLELWNTAGSTVNIALRSMSDSYINGGNLGIGVTSPTQKLDVLGSINLTGTIYSAGASGVSGQVLSSTGTGLAWVDASSVGGTNVFSNGLTDYGSFVGLGGTLSSNTIINTGANSLSFQGLTNNQSLFIGASGYVGIGTTNPTIELDVNGQIRSLRSDTGSRAHAITLSRGLVNAASIGTQGTVGNYSMYIEVPTGSNRMTFSSSGNIGIGTTDPQKHLDVDGTTYGDAIRLGIGPSAVGELWSSQTGTPNGVLSLYYGTSESLRLRANGSSYLNGGNISIGTTASLAKLQVNGTGSSTIAVFEGSGNVGIGITSPLLKLSVNGSVRIGADLYDTNNKNAYIDLADGWGQIKQDTAGLSFGTYYNSALQRDININYLGNVGIGTTAQSKKLDVAGDINLTGTIYSAGASGVSGQVLSSTGTGLAWINASSVGTTYSVTNGLSAISANTFGLGGTLSQNTFINTGASIFGMGVNTTSPALQILSSGNVGIGTSNPTDQLHIFDNAKRPGIVLESSSGTDDLANLTFRNTFSGTTYNGSITTSWYSGGFMKFTAPRDGTTPGYGFRFASNDGTDRLNINTGSGNVGIGTTDPKYKLDVIGDINTNSRIGIGGTDAAFSFHTTSNGRFDTNLSVGGTLTLGQGAASGYILQSDASGNAAWVPSAGVGGTSYTAINGLNLNVSNQFGLGGTLAQNTLVSTNGQTLTLGLNTTSPSLYISSAGNVGIGTSNPGSAKLNVVGADSSFITLISGVTKAIRFGANSTNSSIEGVDNTGVGTYQPLYVGGSTLDFTIAGARKVSIDASGNVGIGTTGPKYKLDVIGDINTNSRIGIGGTDAAFSFHTTSNGRFDTNLSVGGTLTLGQGAASGYILQSDASGNAAWVPSAGVGGTSYTAINGLNLNVSNQFGLGGTLSSNTIINTGANSLSFQGLTNNQSLFIGASGYVGIGTTNPTARLSLGSTLGSNTFNLYEDSTSNMSLGAQSGLFRLNLYGGSNRFGIFTSSSGSEIFTVLSSGNVGIGTTSPGQKLSVVGDAYISTRIGIGTSSAIRSVIATGDIESYTHILTPDLIVNTMNTTYGGGTTIAIIPGVNITGSVGIGTSTPSAKLDVVGSIRSSVGVTSPLITLTSGAGAGKILQSDASGNAAWVTATGVGGTYTAGTGLTLSSTSVFSLNLGNTNVWLAPQIFNNNIGVTGNMTIGGTAFFNNIFANGNVGFGTTAPTYKLEIVGSGSIFRIGDTAGNTLVNITDSNATFNLPTSFTSNGDISLSYDLNFTNATASYIRSQAPLYIMTDHPTNNVDVVLSAANSGTVIIDDNGQVTGNLTVGGTLTLTQGASAGKILQSDASGNASWVTASGVGGTTYSAGVGLTLSNANVFSLNLGNTNVWLAPQVFNNNIGVTGTLMVSGNGNITNSLTIGTSLSVGSSATVSGNLSANGGLSQDGNIILNGTDTWLRTTGATGWYSATYGGGIYMTDANWIRNYNSKAIQITGNGTQSAAFMNGNVGIGTTSPLYQLDVAGIANVTQLGIGGTSTAKLNVVGNGNITTNLSIGGTLTLSQGASAGKILQSDASGNASWVTASGVGGTTYSATNGLNLNVSNQFGLGGTLTQLTKIDQNNNNIGFFGTGNFGIGTTNPNGKLEIIVPSYNDQNNSSQQVVIGSGATAGNGVRIGYNDASNTGFLNVMKPSAAWGNLAISPFSGVGTGYVGIGTSSPIEKLDIRGNALFSGNVGIGFTSPLYKLHVAGSVGSTSLVTSDFLNIGTSATIGTNLKVGNSVTFSNLPVGTGSSMVYLGAGGILYSGTLPATYSVTNGLSVISANTFGLGGTLTQATQIGTSNFALSYQGLFGTQSLFIGATGYVGIGTTNPREKLEISGNMQLNGRIFSGDGSVAFPSFSFMNDVDNGMYRVGTNTISLVTGGANAMIITSNGNVGVGFTSPVAKLHVVGTGTSNIAIFDGLGNVGIGTSSPTAKLTINGDLNVGTSATISTNLRVGGSVTFSALPVGTGTSVVYIGAGGILVQGTLPTSSVGATNGLSISGGSVGIGGTISQAGFTNINIGAGSSGLRFLGLGNTQSLFIAANGNVGIGTTTTTYKLELVGASSIFRIGDTGGNDLVTITDASAQFNLPTNFTSSGDVSMANDLVFTNAISSAIHSAAPLLIESGESYNSSDLTLKTYNYGNIVLDAGSSGAIVPASNLITDLGSATSRFNNTWTKTLNIGSSTWSLQSPDNARLSFFNNSTGGTEAFTIQSNGNVGIGTTNPTTPLTVNGTITAGRFSSLSNSNYYLDPSNSSSISPSLSLYSSGSVMFNVFSTGTTQVTLTTGASTRLQSYINGFGVATNSGAQGVGATIAWTEALFVGNSGYVGIGTTNPGTPLNVISTSANVGTAQMLRLSGVKGDPSGYYLNFASQISTGTVDYQISTNDNTGGVRDIMTIDAATGNIGIGNTNPGRRLSINGGGISFDDSTSRSIHWGNGTTFPVMISGDPVNGNITFNVSAAGVSATEKMRIDSSGNFGIGTPNPTNTLSVFSNLNSNVNAVFQNSATNGFSGMNFLDSNGTLASTIVHSNSAAASYPNSTVFGSLMNESLHLVTGTSALARLSITTNGNVGIGTTSPTSLLQVGTLVETTPATNTGLLKVTGSPQTTFESVGGIELPVATNGYGVKIQALSASGAALSIARRNASATWTESLRIDASGDVGIGTSNPNANLDVVGPASTNTAIRILETGTAESIFGHIPSSQSLFISNGTGIGAAALANQTKSITLNSSGFVGIGNTNPTQITQISGDLVRGVVGGTGQLALTGISNTNKKLTLGYDTTGNYGFIEAHILGSGWSNLAIQTGGGNVGIGTTAPSTHKLSVVGTAGLSTGTVWTNTSDRRVKQDISVIGSGLDTINSLKPSQYNYTPAYLAAHPEIENVMHYGFIAQEFQQVFPNSVTTGGDGYLQVNQTNVIPYTVKAIQELNTKLDNVSFTTDGQVNVEYNVSESVLASLGYQGSKNEIEAATYSHKINTGLLKTINLIAKNIVAETTKSKTIKTDIITPLDDVTDTIAIDGNLDIAGTLTAQDASFSTVYADNVVSKNGNLSDVIAQKITDLRSEIQSTIASIGVTTPVATPSALVADSTGWTYDTTTDQTTVSGSMSLTDNMVVGAKLTVLGDTQLGNAFITGTFTAGEIAIKDNFIETTATALYIQPSGIGSVNLMNNTLVIAENGEVTLNGNLAISGKMIASEASVAGSLFGNLITANEITTKKLTTESVNIATESAVIIAQGGFAELATSSAQLSTNATAGTITMPAGKTELVIYNPKVTSSSMVYLTPVGSTNNQVVYLKSKFISPTPIVPTAVIASDSATTDQSNFTIALDSPLAKDIQVNWWIIN